MKKFVSGLILFFLLLKFFTGCQKNQNLTPNTKPKNNFSVEQAQANFGTENVRSFNLKSGDLISHSIEMKPDWCDSKESQNDQVEIVEIGIYMLGGISFADDPSYQEWKTCKQKYKNDEFLDQIGLSKT